MPVPSRMTDVRRYTLAGADCNYLVLYGFSQAARWRRLQKVIAAPSSCPGLAHWAPTF